MIFSRNLYVTYFLFNCKKPVLEIFHNSFQDMANLSYQNNLNNQFLAGGNLK